MIDGLPAVRPGSNSGGGPLPRGTPGSGGGVLPNATLGEPNTGVRGGIPAGEALAPGGGYARGGRSAGAGRPGGTRGASKPTRPAWLPEEEGRAAASAPLGTHGAARRRADGSAEPQHFDPGNPWAVREGVDPVIVPADRNDRHDPGPNVIGRRG